MNRTVLSWIADFSRGERLSPRASLLLIVAASLGLWQLCLSAVALVAG